MNVNPGVASPTGLRIERRGPLVRLLLDRPRRGNALDAQLVDRLIEAVGEAAADGIRLLAFQGVGNTFCSGFDFSDLDAQSEGDLALRFLRIEQLLQSVFHFPGDTVALAHGRVFGAGADLFCACDRRIVAPETTFRFPGVRFGIVLGTRRLGARLGPSRARDVLLGGAELDAEMARSGGLATEIAEPSEWPVRLEAALGQVRLVPQDTARAVRNCLRDHTQASDMADLAASVAAPGLKERIQTYRNQIKAK